MSDTVPKAIQTQRPDAAQATAPGSPRGVPLRRILPHGYFELRVEEECIRAERFEQEFGVVRVGARAEESALLVERLANVLRVVDVVAEYAPGEFEALLCDTPRDGVHTASQRLRHVLTEAGLQPRVGIACYPQDGRSAAELLEGAGQSTPLRRAEPLVIATADSPALQRVYALVDRIAPSEISVLVTGETGVGKELLARRIHERSKRGGKALLTLNCAALTESLLESELFGHEKGAFTGAVQSKPGLLETAQGGSVFLDELGELPLGMQAKLLRVLEQREVLRVGGLKARSIDVRFIAATNRDLETAAARGTFRRDLLYRLAGVTVEIPPLRERVEELEPLTARFLEEARRRVGRDRRLSLSESALQLLRAYPWPGNIRELRNVIERAVLLCDGPEITPEHLPREKLSGAFAPLRTSTAPPKQESLAPSELPPAVLAPGDARAPGPRLSGLVPDELQQAAREAERRRILDALASCGGNQTAAAKKLNVSRRTLVNRLTLYGITRPRKGREELDNAGPDG